MGKLPGQLVATYLSDEELPWQRTSSAFVIVVGGTEKSKVKDVGTSDDGVESTMSFDKG